MTYNIPNVFNVQDQQKIYQILFNHVGEAGNSESAIEVLERLSDFWKSNHPKQENK